MHSRRINDAEIRIWHAWSRKRDANCLLRLDCTVSVLGTFSGIGADALIMHRPFCYFGYLVEEQMQFHASTETHPAAIVKFILLGDGIWSRCNFMHRRSCELHMMLFDSDIGDTYSCITSPSTRLTLY